MKDICDEFYDLLAKDYDLYGKDSVISRHYIGELSDAVKRHMADGNADQGRLSETAKIYMQYNGLGKEPNAEAVFEFIRSCFTAFARVPELYSQPKMQRGKETIQKEVDGELKSVDKTFLNNKTDYRTIVDALWPYLAFPLALNDRDKQELIEKRKKTSLKTLVKKLVDMLTNTPDEVYEAYKKEGLLKNDDHLQSLYEHVIDRSIDKSFKDFLYTEGYSITYDSSDDAKSGESSEGPRVKRLVPGKGRKNAKPDKMIKLLSELCEKNGIISLSGLSLDDADMAERIKELYCFINDNYKGAKKLTFSHVLAYDVHTGVSLQLLGNAFTKRKEPCTFAVLNRNDGECSMLSYEYYDDDGEQILIGSAESGDNVDDAYRIAKERYRECVEISLDMMREENASYYSELTRHKRTGILKYFGYAMHDELDDKKMHDEELLRREIDKYVKEASPNDE